MSEETDRLPGDQLPCASWCRGLDHHSYHDENSCDAAQCLGCGCACVHSCGPWNSCGRKECEGCNERGREIVCASPASPSPPKPSPPSPSPPPPVTSPDPPGPPPPALFVVNKDECRLAPGYVQIADGKRLRRSDFERMGLVKPEWTPLKANGDPLRELRFQLILLFKHWEPDYIIRIALQGELVRLEAVRGGHLAVDNRESTFDDALAESLGLHGGAGDGFLQSQHGSSFADAQAHAQASSAKHNNAKHLPEVVEKSSEIAIKLEELDGNDDDEDDDDGPGPPRVNGMPMHTLILAGRGVVDSVRWVHCTRLTPPEPPPPPPTNLPPPPPDPPWRDINYHHTSDTSSTSDDPWAIIERASHAPPMPHHLQQFDHLHFLPKHMRDQMQAGLEGLQPLIYTSVTLSFLFVCLLCVRRLCCAGRDAEGGGGGGGEGGRKVGGEAPIVYKATLAKEPPPREKRRKKKAKRQSEEVDAAESEPIVASEEAV